MKSIACAFHDASRLTFSVLMTYRLAAVVALLLASAVWFSAGAAAVANGGVGVVGGNAGVGSWTVSACLAALVVWIKREVGRGIPTRR